METIEISDKIKRVLDNMKSKNDNYNDLMEKMIEDEQELNKKTIQELKIAKKGKSYSHQEIKKRFNL